MDILLTFDYELCLGLETGTVTSCILNPTEQITSILKRFDVRATFYVDVGYLLKCKTLNCDMESYVAVTEQLDDLQDAGHDIQLHIHPLWEEANFTHGKWDLSNTRYRLHQFSKPEAESIIRRYCSELKEICRVDPIAYRAGGWCIQPFKHFSDQLYSQGIRVDSTIFSNGKTTSEIYGFDFSKAPLLATWKFNDDPLEAVDNGRSWELPIASIKVTPFFYWQYLGSKLSRMQRHKSFGDGTSTSLNWRQIFTLLSKESYSTVSMDAYKSKLLEFAYRKHRQHYGQNAEMVFIGHPKAATPFSLENIKRFITRHHETDRFITTSQWYKEKVAEDD